MSFGFSVGDFIVLTQLAFAVVQNSRKACGAHDQLTREVSNLHIVLRRLQHEVEKPHSIVNRTGDGRLDELNTIVKGCSRMLKTVDERLNKYNGMSGEKRMITRGRLKVQFGNGEMKDIEKIRQELATYTNAITLFLNLLSLGSQGKVEQYMERNGDQLRQLRQSLNWITATLQANSDNREGSILTSYGLDDKAIWKEFRRELLMEGFSSDELRKHKDLIKEYVMELGARGALDVLDTEDHILDLGDTAEEIPGAGKSKEVEQEIVPVLESTPSEIQTPDSKTESYYRAHGRSNTTSLRDDALNQPALESESASESDTASTGVEEDEGDDEEEERYDEEEKGFGRTETVNGTLDCPPSGTSAESKQHELNSPLTKRRTAITPKRTSSKKMEDKRTFQPTIKRAPFFPKHNSSRKVEDEPVFPSRKKKTATTPRGVSATEVVYGDSPAAAYPNHTPTSIVANKSTESLNSGDGERNHHRISSFEIGPDDRDTRPVALLEYSERTGKFRRGSKAQRATAVTPRTEPKRTRKTPRNSDPYDSAQLNQSTSSPIGTLVWVVEMGFRVLAVMVGPTEGSKRLRK